MSAPAETFRRADGEPDRSHPGRTNAIQHLDGRLKDLLAGKKILMTGVTGFIGEQLLWKILTELPDTKVAVLVRRKRSAAAWERMLGVVKKDDLQRGPGGRRRPRAAARGPGRRDRGRPAERPEAAAATSTSSCTAPATCPSTRPSTRRSRRTSSAPRR